MGMRTGNVDKEESDDRNETRVVESRGDGKTTGIYLFQDGPNLSCVQVAEKEGNVSGEGAALRRQSGMEGKGTLWDLWNWEKNSQKFHLG